MELARIEKVDDPTLDPVAIEAFEVFEKEWRARQRVVAHRKLLRKRASRFRRAGAAKHPVLGCSFCGIEKDRYTVARLAWTEVHICSGCVARMQEVLDELTAEQEGISLPRVLEDEAEEGTVLLDDDDAWPPAEDAAQ
jgi:hypothetical protein